MHELSISNSIARAVIDNAQKNKATKVLTINLAIGDLVFLNTDQVRFWLNELFKDTVAREAEVKISPVKPKIKCLDCNYQGGIKFEEDSLYHTSFPLFLCPECNAYNIEVLQGKECLLKDIKLEV